MAMEENMMEKILNDMIKEIVDTIGLGHRESVYQHSLAVEMRFISYKVETEIVKVVFYKGFTIGSVRIDMIIGDKYIVEFKAVQKVSDKEKQQLRNYLKIYGFEFGYIINVNHKEFEVIVV